MGHDMTVSVAFGLRLREMREERGISQDTLSRVTGIHDTAIGRFERGAREPRLTTIMRLARGLGVRPGVLVDGLSDPADEAPSTEAANFVAVSPARHNPYDGEPPSTRLARARLSRGVTQDELAVAVGVSVPTLRRLERGEVANPKLRNLVNCSIALGVDLNAVLEDAWLEWLPTADAVEPPKPREFWRSPRPSQ